MHLDTADSSRSRPFTDAPVDVPAYLRRIGVSDPGSPSVSALRRLHRAHVSRVPYENLEIHLGRPTTVDPHESVERIAHRHRGGYCFHLNGALGTLLSALGYDVTWHVGGVQGRDEVSPPGANGNHLVLTVRGLPDPACPDGVWLVDAGLGDGLYDPLPLRTGRYPQGPFTYELSPSRVVDGGWRFTHDPSGSFAGMDFAMAPAGPDDFSDMHIYLSTSAESPFVRTASVQRRRPDGVDALIGCRLRRWGAGEPSHRILDDAGEWYSTLAEVFGLALADVSPTQRRELWHRVRRAHAQWLATQPAGEAGEAGEAGVDGAETATKRG